MLDDGLGIVGFPKKRSDFQGDLSLVGIERIVSGGKRINAAVQQQFDGFRSAFFGGVVKHRCIVPDDPNTGATATPSDTCLQIGAVVD